MFFLKYPKLFPSLPFWVLQIFSFWFYLGFMKLLTENFIFKTSMRFYGICFYLIFDLGRRNHLEMMNIFYYSSFSVPHFCWKHFFFRKCLLFSINCEFVANLITKWSEDFLKKKKTRRKEETRKGNCQKTRRVERKKKLHKSTEKMDKKSIRENILRWCSCDNKWLFTSILDI